MNLSIDLKRKKRNEVNILSVETSESGSSRRWRRSFFFKKRRRNLLFHLCVPSYLLHKKRIEKWKDKKGGHSEQTIFWFSFSLDFFFRHSKAQASRILNERRLRNGMQIDAFFSLLTLPLHFQIPKSKQKQTSRHLKPCNADSVGEDKDKKRVVIISTGNHFSRLLFNPLVDTKTRHFCSFICACYFTDTRIPCVCVHVAHTSYYRVSNFSPPVVYCFLHTNFL